MTDVDCGLSTATHQDLTLNPGIIIETIIAITRVPQITQFMEAFMATYTQQIVGGYIFGC